MLKCQKRYPEKSFAYVTVLLISGRRTLGLYET
jgi:hypothetical protein